MSRAHVHTYAAVRVAAAVGEEIHSRMQDQVAHAKKLHDSEISSLLEELRAMMSRVAKVRVR